MVAAVLAMPIPSVREPDAPWGAGRPSGNHFPPCDPRGHVFEAQVELEQAWSMLDVLVRLCAENTGSEPARAAGWCGLLSAVQEHVGLASASLREWRNEIPG